MLTKRAIGTGLCTLALGLGAAQLYGDGAGFQGGNSQCADGSCTPRRITNGYYPTKWRPWPVTPPSPPKRGTQGVIPPPPYELPAPENEAKLPEGALPPPSSPPPVEQGPEAAPPGREVPNGAVPPRREAPRIPSAPEPGLPPELRNDVPRPGLDGQGALMPLEPRPLQRPPRAAQTSLELPADEPQTNAADAIWRPATSLSRDRATESETLFPKTQFADLTKMPLHAPNESDVDSAEAAAGTRVGARLAALRQTKPVPLPSTESDEDAAPESSDTPKKISVSWTPSRNLQFLDRTHGQDAAAPVASSTMDHQETGSQPVIRVSTSGPNTPVALGAIRSTTAVRPAIAISESSAAGPSAYAVQASAHSEWSGSARVDNPLRGQRTEQQTVFESREVLATDASSLANDRHVDLEAPANPLR